MGAVKAIKWLAASVVLFIAAALAANAQIGTIPARSSSSSGAPADAQYWTGAADATLSAEKNLGGLSTALVLNTSGVPSAYAGTSCTNQFPRSLSAVGAATCASVAESTDISGFGTGIATALAVNTGSAGAPVLFNGAGGTPSSLTGTNITGVPVSTGVSGLGTGVATALAVNTGSAGAPVLFNGAGGTPTSLALTNATGLPCAAGVPTASGCLVESHTASAASSVDFTSCISATYDNYHFEINSAVPGTSGDVLWMRMNTGGGFDTGANYSYDDFAWRQAGSALGGAQSSATKIIVTYSVLATTRGVSGFIDLYNARSTTQMKDVVGLFRIMDSSNIRASNEMTGTYEVSGSALTQVQFLMSSGNISGTIRCYGKMQ